MQWFQFVKLNPHGISINCSDQALNQTSGGTNIVDEATSRNIVALLHN